MERYGDLENDFLDWTHSACEHRYGEIYSDEQPCHHLNRVFGLLHRHQVVSVCNLCSLAKKAAAFFRNSFSISSSRMRFLASRSSRSSAFGPGAGPCDLLRARNLQRGIVNMYEMDMAKYVSDTLEARQVQMVYESIPSQLNSENKRFKYARLGKSLRFANLEFAFDWLEHVGVALPAFRVNEPTFPLAAHEDRNMLKLYANDVGLLTAQMMGDVDIDILNRRSSINFGSIFENVAAQEFKACGRELRYYNSSKIGEVDFVLQGQQGGKRSSQ